MKVFKVGFGLVIIVGVCLLGVLAYILKDRNILIKDFIEAQGPEITKTTVSMGGVDIGLLNGKGELNNFAIANPEGFTRPNAFSADRFLVDLDQTSLFDEVVVIENLVIDGIHITAEQKGLTNNIQTIIKSVNQFR